MGVTIVSGSTGLQDKVWQGTCNTSNNIKDKEVNVGNGFILGDGVKIRIYFNEGNTASGVITLNVNSTGAFEIVPIDGGELPYNFISQGYYDFTYTEAPWGNNGSTHPFWMIDNVKIAGQNSYGFVKVTDRPSNTLGAGSGTAVSPKALQTVKETADAAATPEYVDNTVEQFAQDALMQVNAMLEDYTTSEEMATALENYVTLETANIMAENFLPKTGGTMTGVLLLNANPTENLGAATKQYVDSTLNKYLPLNIEEESETVSNENTWLTFNRGNIVMEGSNGGSIEFVPYDGDNPDGQDDSAKIILTASPGTNIKPQIIIGGSVTEGGAYIKGINIVNDDTDVANKKYVDDIVANISGGGGNIEYMKCYASLATATPTYKGNGSFIATPGEKWAITLPKNSGKNYLRISGSLKSNVQNATRTMTVTPYAGGISQSALSITAPYLGTGSAIDFIDISSVNTKDIIIRITFDQTQYLANPIVVVEAF